MDWSEDRFKARTTENGKVWQQVADNLNLDHTLQVSLEEIRGFLEKPES